ncbi:MAG: hypothetical protein C0616_05090 [Desulfuromonas sp.]|nr:MAG: hypothetical protein C0616_05090 [Desulfuromonas sp.]
MSKPHPNQGSTPLDVLNQRMAALQAGDFAAIYHSTHPESFFRQQFPSLEEYLRFSDEMLAGGQSQIKFCTFLQQRVTESEALVLLHQRTTVGGTSQESLELTMLKKSGQEWLYHSSQRVLVEDLAIKPQAMTIDLFAKLLDTVTF